MSLVPPRGRCFYCGHDHDGDLVPQNDLIRDRLDAAESTLAKLRKNTFPVLRETGKAAPLTIPLSVAEKAYSVYRQNHNQSLETLGRRGGFAPSELDEYVPGWREEVSEIEQLRATLAKLREIVPDTEECDDWCERCGQYVVGIFRGGRMGGVCPNCDRSTDPGLDPIRAILYPKEQSHD